MLNRKNKPANINAYIPTPYECAALSYDTYSYFQVLTHWERDPSYPDLPSGWKRHYLSDATLTDGDYCGACYIKWDPDPVAIVIANRGTLPTSISNLSDCINVINEKFTRNSQFADDFLIKIDVDMQLDPDLQPYQEQINSASVTYTGHSLGGYSADWQYFQNSFMEDRQSITFDNPGSYGAILKYIEDNITDPQKREENIWLLNESAKRSFNYVAHMNCINTCNSHLGSVFVFKDLPFNYKLGDDYDHTPTPAISADMLQNFYYLNYSLDQHQMVNIYNYLKNNGTFELDLNHVIGVKEAFLDYLWIEKHAKFWNGYIEFVWDNYPEIRDRYLQDESKYIEDMYDTIRAVRETAAQTYPLHVEIETPKLAQPSKIGLFANKSKQSELEDDFVLVSRDNPSVDNTPAKPSKCNII